MKKLQLKTLKFKIRKAINIGIVAFGFRYSSINPIPITLSANSNSAQPIQQNLIEEDLQLINADMKLIKTGSGVLISNKCQGSNSALGIQRGGDLGKSGPGPRAKADASRHFTELQNRRRA